MMDMHDDDFDLTEPYAGSTYDIQGDVLGTNISERPYLFIPDFSQHCDIIPFGYFKFIIPPNADRSNCEMTVTEFAPQHADDEDTFTLYYLSPASLAILKKHLAQ
jgi:hypothetical protein